jgi:broad specificity phosphatase PhoE
MTLYLLRHGPTHARGMTGWTDLPADLSDSRRLDRLRAALAGLPCVSSDLSRAVATADAVATGPRRPHDPSLREIHFGAWEGLTHDQAEARDPALIRAFWDDPGAIAAPGGESWDDLAARVGAALATLQGPTLIVAHFGAILAAVGHLTGEGPRALFRHRIDPLSLTVLVPAAGGWRLAAINHHP